MSLDYPFKVFVCASHSGKWLAFDRPLAVIRTDREDAVIETVGRVERLAAENGWYAAGFLAYEAAPGFDNAFRTRDPDGFPLVWFGLYDKAEAVWLPQAAGPAEPVSWRPSITQAEYLRAIACIREFIRRGDIYQANYSYRLLAERPVDPWQLFLRMVQGQGGHYGAYIELEDWIVSSASPELFFERQGDHLRSRPMKGTRRRGLWPADDQARARELRQSEKDRAENTMIVDVVRNDLSRVARPGSVRATRLFDVEQYHTVWQMTSTVECQSSASLVEILEGLFPPASVTGAPKIRSTEVIAELETLPRRIYTGSIGLIEPGGRFQFNIAIRTLLIDKRRGQAEYGTGGGIVWDSVDRAEFDECADKARILSHVRPEFQLLETLLWTAERGFHLLEGHLRRLAESAAWFGWRMDEQAVRLRLEGLARELAGGSAQRVRLLMAEDGSVAFQHQSFDYTAADAKLWGEIAGDSLLWAAQGGAELIPDFILSRKPWRITLATGSIDRSDPFLYHKTTHRAIYDRARGGRAQVDDVLLFNEAGELTESTLANVALEREGRLITPPIKCGLLGGVCRDHLLASGRLTEAVIRVDELRPGDRLILLNSVRGLWPAVFQL